MADSQAPKGQDPDKAIPSPSVRKEGTNGDVPAGMPPIPPELSEAAPATQTPFGQGVGPTPSIFLTEVQEIKDELYGIARLSAYQLALLAALVALGVIIFVKGTGNVTSR